MSEKGILGCDPGLSGALVLLSRDKKIMEKKPIPTIKNLLDVASLNRWLREIRFQIEHVYLESVSSRPGQSCVSTFKFGRVYGCLEGLFTGNNIPYTLVTPKVWTKEICAGIEKMKNPKDRSIVALSRLFPDVDLRPTERSKKPHLGLLDGLLIAEYGRRKYWNQ